MPIDARTPAWLESLSARPVTGLSELGSLAGRYIGAGIDAALPSGDQQIDQKPYFDRFRESMVNQQKFAQDPQWRLKEMVAQGHMRAQELQGQSLAIHGIVAMRSLQQQVDSEKEMLNWSNEVQAKGSDPQHVLDTPYLGSNPITSRQVGQAQLNASRALVQNRLNSDKILWNKMISSLDPEDMATAMAIPNGEGGNPSPEKVTFIQQAALRKQNRVEAEKQAKLNKPMSTLGKLIADRDAAEAAGQDVSAYDSAIKAHDKSSEVVIEKKTVGGKNFFVATQPGFGGYRLIPADDNTKEIAAEKRALEWMKQAAFTALTNPRTRMDKVATALAQSKYDDTTAQLAELNKGLLSKGQDVPDQSGTNAPVAAPTQPSTNAAPKEVIRLTKDGKRAVFDADTKAFLRYAE